MATTTINDSVTTSAELIAKLKRDLRLSEPTLVKLFEINVGWSLATRGQPSAEESADDPHFTQADADALLAEHLGINQEGPEANEIIGDETTTEDPTPEPVAV